MFPKILSSVYNIFKTIVNIVIVFMEQLDAVWCLLVYVDVEHQPS
jgi:hypothetical protein